MKWNILISIFLKAALSYSPLVVTCTLWLVQVWPEVFEAELGELPSDLKAPCCAEFMVSRDRVLAHSRDFYTHLRDWIVDTELGRYRSGRVFEYMWHIIFGEPHMIDAVSECQLLHCDNSPTSWNMLYFGRARCNLADHPRVLGGFYYLTSIIFPDAWLLGIFTKEWQTGEVWCQWLQMRNWRINGILAIQDMRLYMHRSCG